MTQEDSELPKATISKRELMGLRNITNSLNIQTIATRGLFILALFYTLYFGQQLLVPIFFAFLVYFLLKPSVNYLQKKFRIPKYLGSALVLCFGFVVIGLGIFYLSAQAQTWMQNAPQIFDTFNTKLTSLTGFFQKPVEILTEFTGLIKESFNLPTQQATQQSWIGLVFASTWEFLVEFSIFIVLLYFLLAAEKSFLTKLIILSLPSDNKKDANYVVQQIEKKVWQYLFAKTVISVVLAVVLSIVFFIMDFPNPILWGVIVGILEYLPYIGALISMCLITMISVVSYESVWQMFSVIFAFFIIINLAGNILTPYVIGKTFVLDSVEVVLWIFILGWLWGALGAFLAIPLMMTLKIILDNVNEDNFMKTLSE